MELIVLNSDQLVKYNVTYNEAEMHNFMRDIINQYGVFREGEIKAKNGNEILSYCNAYRDAKILKTYEDNTRVHKGRKRVPKKNAVKSYLYSVTLIDYPEIYHTIYKFIRQKELDFSVFEKYIKASEVVVSNDINYYIEEGYMSYDKEGLKKLKQSLTNEKEFRKYIENLANKRLLQRECLKAFYELLILNPIQYGDVNNNELNSLFNNLYSTMSRLPELSRYSDDQSLLNQAIHDKMLVSQMKPANIERAAKNFEVIEAIKSETYVKVKR